MFQKISKKSIQKPIIVTLIVAAAVSLAVLIYGLIISGTAEKAIRTMQFEFVLWRESLFNDRVMEPHPIDSLKPGKYMLERDWGLDETDYIEVYDDFTLRFVGEYWIDRKNENLAQDPNYYEPGIVDRTERISYEMDDTWQMVQFSHATNGFDYADENTLIISRLRDEKDDVVDHEYSLNKDPEWVDAYYIYAE